MLNIFRQRLDEERRTLTRAGESREVLADVVRLQIGAHRSVAWSAFDAASADAVIAREIAHHRALGAAFEWKVYAHDEPADLVERLGRHGLTVGPCEAVMIFDLAHLPPWLMESPPGPVTRIDRPEQLDDYRRVLRDVHGRDDDASVDEIAAALCAGDRGVRGYIAYVADVPASVGRLYTNSQSWFGGLYGGATSTPFRGRGLYRALVAARARDALQLGARCLIVDALPTSRPILERLGFTRLTDTWPCEFTP